MTTWNCGVLTPAGVTHARNARREAAQFHEEMVGNRKFCETQKDRDSAKFFSGEAKRAATEVKAWTYILHCNGPEIPGVIEWNPTIAPVIAQLFTFADLAD